jgi:hypothetical protein
MTQSESLRKGKWGLKWRLLFIMKRIKISDLFIFLLFNLWNGFLYFIIQFTRCFLTRNWNFIWSWLHSFKKKLIFTLLEYISFWCVDYNILVSQLFILAVEYHSLLKAWFCIRLFAHTFPSTGELCVEHNQ